MKRYFIPILLGFVFGCCTFLSISDGEIATRNPLLWILCFFYTALFVVLFFLIDRFSSYVQIPQPPSDSFGRIKKAISLEWRIRDIVIGGLIIFILWLPWLIALAPGVLWFDTSRQIYELLTPGIAISDRHPVFAGAIFASASAFGDAVFNDQLLGNWFLCLIQSVIAAIAMSIQCCWLQRIRVPWYWRTCCISFAALNPAMPLFFSTLAKDTLFAPAHIIFCIIIVEIIYTRGESFKDSRWLIALVASILLMVLTKKAATFVVAPCLLAIMVFLRLRGRAVAVCGLCIALSVCAIPAFNSAFSASTQRTIVHDWRLEAVAVPLQQVANAVNNDPAIKHSEYASVLDGVFRSGLKGVKNDYDWKAADGVKSKGGDADLIGFLQAWAILAPGHMNSYTEAWLGLVTDWFSFNEHPNMLYTSHRFSSEHTLEEWRELVGNRTSTLAGDEVTSFIGGISKVPFLLLLSQKCLWATIVPFLSLFLALRSKNFIEGTLAILPALLSMFVLMVGPTSIWSEGIRYVAPMMCTAPVWITVSIWKMPKK